MANNDTSVTANDAADALKGLLLLIFIGWAVWTFWLGAEPEKTFSDIASTDDPAFSLTIGEYKVNLDADERSNLIRQYASLKGIGNAEQFRVCMGDYAARKNEALKFRDIFGWCENEAKLNPEDFENHYDELDGKDYSYTAASVCENIIEQKLLSPASAEHAGLARRTLKQGRARYKISSYVDAQNIYGAMLRTHYFCDVQYSLLGHPHDYSKWKVHAFETTEQ